MRNQVAVRLTTLAQAVALAAVVLPASSRAEQTCSGCVGGTSSSSQSIPGCDSVEITVTIESGLCVKTTHPPDPTEYCEEVNDCDVTIQRTWTNIPTGSQVNGCVIQGGQRYCIDPPLDSDGGSGSDTRQYKLECGSGTFTWTIKAGCSSAPGGQMDAQASGQCTGCAWS